MNANELADYITQNSYIGTVTMEDVATMLRQQQAEIEHLKELFGCDPAYYERSAKTLTDEEIEGIAKANVDGHASMEQLKWFARAILKKASE